MVRTIILLCISSEIWCLFTLSTTLDAIIDNINVTVIHFMYLFRYRNWMNYIDFYKRLATSMESPHFDTTTPQRKKLLNYWIDMNEKYFKVIVLIATGALSIWYVFPLLDDIEYNLMGSFRVPYDYKTPVRYPFTYVIFLLGFHYSSYFVVVIDVILQSHLLHQICQFDILTDCFEKIVNDCSVHFKGIDEQTLYLNEAFRQQYIDRLGVLVEQHKFLLKNILELRSILSMPMLGQLVASTSLICLAGYQVTAMFGVSLTKFLMTFLYLNYNLFTFYVLCRWCEEIKFKSESIREAVYYSGWERGIANAHGVRRRLMLVAVRASRPLVLTAGGLYDLSLDSYATLVRAAYSALTLLLRARHRY